MTAARIRRGVAMAAVLALAASGVPGTLRAQAPAVPVTKTTIAGIPVILKRVTANDVVAVQLYLDGGSAALTPDKAGIENLIGSAMTNGTEKYGKDRFAALATSTGTTIGATAGYDFTTFTAQGVRQNWNDTWDLFTQAVLHPTFPADEVAQVKEQLINGLRQRADDPDTYLEMLADSAVYAGRPYAIDPEGTAASVAKLTRDDLVAWHARRFTKGNLLLVVVGNVSPADLRAKVTAAFGALPATGGGATPAAALTSAAGPPVTAKRDLPTSYVEGVFAAPSLAGSDFPALRVAILVLTDRLFEEVRTKRNLTYATFAQLFNRRANRGRIYVTAVDPDTTTAVMLGVVKGLRDTPVSAQLLHETVNVFATNYLMGQQTNMGQATALATWELTGGGYAGSIGYVNRLRTVTPAQLQAAARKYLGDFRWVRVGR
ncbi:MAG TPA: pitrilysin family protein [Gemmatimonadaceae bacterium]|nr:pitrilysin family protein [Gemmatimonadaceae bacterium]